MSLVPNPSQVDAESSVAAFVDRTCDRFESAWQTGQCPRIEDYLGETAEPLYSSLLRELLHLECDYRRSHGEQPDIQQYLDQFPSHTELVHQVLGQFLSVDTSSETLTHTASQSDITVTAAARYLDLHFHDSGGLGEVFRASDENLHREVALKFIQHAHLANQELRDRFVLEAEVTSRLDHPGVVPVYAIGESWDRRPFYAMRFIEGRSLQQAINEFHRTDWKTVGSAARRQALHRLVRHLAAACNTIAYANNRCIVHCDIKPANIMLGRFGETLVVDWGLAVSVKREEVGLERYEKTLPLSSGGPSDSTASGAGTLPFMSPEQCPDSIQPITPRTDVYGLGATLYTLLTGSTRFHGCTREQAYEKIRRGDFPRPRNVEPRGQGREEARQAIRPDSIPPALEAICLKAMHTRPEDRYPSALHMAQDLESWLSDEPVSVYREPLFERVVRLARRRQSWAQSLGLTALLVLLTASVSAVSLASLYRSEKVAREMAATARQDALGMAAHYTAEALGKEVELRWQILEGDANHQIVGELLSLPADERAIGSAAQKELQSWIAERFWEHHAVVPAASWFLTDEHGIQIGRYPPAGTIGEPFAYRSYFHGGRGDLQPGESEGIVPISQPHLTAGFVSQATRELMVAFAVPVWSGPLGSPRRRVIGVLAMTVESARFQALAGHGERWSISLVDLKPDQIEGQFQAGLVLHHPELFKRRLHESAQPTPNWVWRLSAEQQALCDDVAQRTWRHEQQLRQFARQGRHDYERRPVPGSLQLQYQDPVLGPDRNHSAALAPVFVSRHAAQDRLRPEDALQDIGWMVIVQQRGTLER